jgi:hypothetical protein
VPSRSKCEGQQRDREAHDKFKESKVAQLAGTWRSPFRLPACVVIEHRFIKTASGGGKFPIIKSGLTLPSAAFLGTATKANVGIMEQMRHGSTVKIHS